MPPTVLLTFDLPDRDLEPLREFATLLRVTTPGTVRTREESLRLAADADGIVCQGELRIDAELLAAAPRLRVVANTAIGVDNFDQSAMSARGVWGTNTPDAFVDATADCTLGLLLALVRKLVAGDRFVRAGGWTRRSGERWSGMELRGKTWGIVGYGNIGRAVQARAEAFGVKVVVYSRSSSALPHYLPLDELLATSDIVSLHTPLTPQTRHLLDATRLRRMKPGSVLLNLARGPVVDEAALVAALLDGHLAGAALDVFEQEPLVHPVLPSLPNVVLTPHVGGSTRESRARAQRLCVDNVAAVLRGQPPLTPVNRPVGV